MLVVCEGNTVKRSVCKVMTDELQLKVHCTVQHKTATVIQGDTYISSISVPNKWSENCTPGNKLTMKTSVMWYETRCSVV
jgi:hypothetical protein